MLHTADTCAKHLGVLLSIPAVNDIMVVPANVPSLKIVLQLGRSQPQMMGASPGVAETACSQEYPMQAGQLFHLPAPQAASFDAGNNMSQALNLIIG